MDTAIQGATADPSRRSHAPLAGALVLLTVLFGVTTRGLLRETGGHFAYALDDAYIHMAIAKNLAQHGMWGVQADAFASASSSPLWTGLLGAAFRTFGARELLPLQLAALCAIGVLVVTEACLRREQVPAYARFVALAAIVWLTPLVPMIWIGMEHALYIVFVLLVAWSAARRVSGETNHAAVFFALTAAMVATRYEGLFVAAGCALVFAMSRRWSDAVGTSAAALAPVVAVGWWNMSHGWFFLPASIVMKQGVLTDAPDGSLLQGILRNVVATDAPLTFFLVVGAALVAIAYSVSSGGIRRVHPLLVIFMASAVLHFLLARFGWLYRYESYLIALGVFAVGIPVLSPGGNSIGAARRLHHDWLTLTLVAVMAVLVCGERTIVSLRSTAITAGHIFRQQRQMAAFVARYYDSAPVALNDIGAVSYFTHARVHDLIGLGSLEAARERYAARFDARRINAWLDRDRVELAIVYDDVFRNGTDFQRDWVRVGTWHTDSTGIVEATVTFFARNPVAADRLRLQLREFNPTLPSGVDANVLPPM